MRKRWLALMLVSMLVVMMIPSVTYGNDENTEVETRAETGGEMAAAAAAEDERTVLMRATAGELPDDRTAIAGVSQEDPGFTYGPAARDWLEGIDYYYIANEQTKLTIGTNHLDTQHPTDYGDQMTGNNRWGTMTPGHIMDAAPTFNGHDNLDWTTFVLRTSPGHTWWYPQEKLSMPNIEAKDYSVIASGAWDKDDQVKSEVTYSLVEHSPLIKMKIKLKNTGTALFQGHLGYLLDSDEYLEQQSYVPGWGWRGGEIKQVITSGWNENYLFNGIQDKYTGKTAHAIIWPEHQQPSALIPEGYITGAWFAVNLAPDGEQELVLYHLPHNAGVPEETAQVAAYWAKIVEEERDPSEAGIITGTLLDGEGKPTKNVSLILQLPNGDVQATTMTNEAGRYLIYADRGHSYKLVANNGIEEIERDIGGLMSGAKVNDDWTMASNRRTVFTGKTKGDPGFTYDGTSRDWWPATDYYYMESPEIKFTIGTTKTATHHPTDWSNDASGNNKWGSLTPGHMMDAAPRLTMQENLDYSEFVLSDNLGSTPEDEAAGMAMEWSWFHPQTMLDLPEISLEDEAITASGHWYKDEGIKSEVRYSIVEGTPLIRMDITLNNESLNDFDGHFGYIIDPDQPGEQHSYLPGVNWVYSQESQAIKSGWTENYLFNGIDNTFTGKTAHAIIWPDDQQPSMVMHEGIFNGVWFNAEIAVGGQATYVVYHMPHVGGPADKPYAVAEFWAKFIREGGNSADYGSIVGQVLDASGAPVPWTEVLVSDESGQPYAKATSNKDGLYQIYAQQGTYTLTPYNEQYAVQTTTVVIASERRVQADLTMAKVAELEIIAPPHMEADVPFDLTLKVRNRMTTPLEQIEIRWELPYFMEVLAQPIEVIPLLQSGEETEVTIRAAALQGGRSELKAYAATTAFQVSARHRFDVDGAGVFGGDNHTHTKHSDGVNTVAENAQAGYDKRLLSWMWTTDHNTFSHQADTVAVTEQYQGHFLSLAGTEITTPFGHALVYGLDAAPRYDVDMTNYTWQDSIDDVIGQDGALYIAHPFEKTFAFSSPYDWRNFTGVEVWNGNWHALDEGVNERAFAFWDEINMRGDQKYYGIANTDGHTKDKVGDTYIKGAQPSLSEEHVLEMMKQGSFYGTNGPELAFDIDGVGMGEGLQIIGDRTAQFHIRAHDPNSNLTQVRLLRYPITGSIGQLDQREIVFQHDFVDGAVSFFEQTLELPVSDREFYRLEVRSEKANENSTGIGPLTGTGFAFSNPIWVEASGVSNAAYMTNIRYDASLNWHKRMGVDKLSIQGVEYEASLWHFEVNDGAELIEWHANELETIGEMSFGTIEARVQAADGSERALKFLTIFKDTSSEQGVDPGDNDDDGDSGGDGSDPGIGAGDGDGPDNPDQKDGTRTVTAEELRALFEEAEQSKTSPIIFLQEGEAKLELPLINSEWPHGVTLLVNYNGLLLHITRDALEQMADKMSDDGVEMDHASWIWEFRPSDTSRVNAAVLQLSRQEQKDIRLLGHFEMSFYALSSDGQRWNSEDSFSASGFQVTRDKPAGEDAAWISLYRLDADGEMHYQGTLDYNEDGSIRTNILGYRPLLLGIGEYVWLTGEKNFTDVAKQHWAASAIQELVSKQVIEGMTATSFKPEASVTRAEFTVMLVRAFADLFANPLNELKDNQTAFPFEDVAADAWYANEIAIAWEAGWIEGVADVSFAPDDNISREQMAVILARILFNLDQVIISLERVDNIDPFLDHAEMNAWAIEAVYDLYQLRILQGKAEGIFAPQDDATRAEAAQVLQRILHLPTNPS